MKSFDVVMGDLRLATDVLLVIKYWGSYVYACNGERHDRLTRCSRGICCGLWGRIVGKTMIGGDAGDGGSPGQVTLAKGKRENQRVIS